MSDWSRKLLPPLRQKWMFGLSLFVLGIVAFSMVGFRSDPIIALYRDQLSPTMFSIWITGLVLATSSPILCANLFWWIAKRGQHGWLAHLLFVPAIITAQRGAGELMLFAADEPDMDGPTGWATVPAVMLLMLAVVAYFVALAVSLTDKSRPSTNDR